MGPVAWTLLGIVVVASVHPATTAVVRWADGRTVRDPWGPRCVTDTHDLALRDVVPIWSRLSGGPACRTCGAAVPRSLPVVEVSVVALLVAVALRHPGPVLVLLLPVGWSLVVATPIDLDRLIIPDRLTLPLAAWSAASVTGLALATGAWADWRRALLVGAAIPMGMLVLSLAFLAVRGQAGMGMGDVKWSVALGIATGWLGPWPVVGFLSGTILASGVVAIVLVAMGRAGTTRIPFGPYLAMGAAAALLVPAEVIRGVWS